MRNLKTVEKTHLKKLSIQKHYTFSSEPIEVH